VSRFDFKRGDTRDDELIFVKDGAQYDPEAAVIKFGIKLAGATSYLVSTNLFSKTGSGATAVWTFAPSFQTSELNTALNIGGIGAELSAVNAELEFEYTVGTVVVSTKTFPCSIARDINRGNEGTTTFANLTYPAPDAIEVLANKNVANGYCGLNSSGQVASAQLPSYVDDVLEYSTTGGFPATGEAGKIYVATGVNKTYRWSGSTYVEIAASPGTTDSLTEGSTNLYFTNARARAALPDAIGIAVSDEGTNLATGSANLTFRMPYAVTLTSVRANVNTAPVGSTINIDIKRAGTSIFSTLLSIDANEKTSATAATPAVLSTTSLSDDDELVVSIEQVGSTTPGKGLKLWLRGTRA
jgi:hypothetical protein